MKERPILFSGPMVRAILDGRKTQTRRIVKFPLRDRDFDLTLTAGSPFSQHEARLCPYGQPGDRLWVREIFQPIFAEGFDCWTVDWRTGKGYAIRYVATDGRTEWIDGDDNITDRCKPGIHMPRWACRLTLEVVNVRVERLQEISVADCRAEGIEYAVEVPTKQQYQRLWDSINAKRAPWAANPWVWVVEFKKTEAKQ